MSGGPPQRRRSRGFSLFTALFLLVVLGALASYMVTAHVVQQATLGATIRQARALAAAQAGMEWATYRAAELDSCAAASFTLTEGSMAGFAVSVSCSRTVHRIRNTDVRYYALQAEARRGIFGTPEFVSRAIRATVANPPP